MNMALAGLVVLVLGDSHMAGRDYLIASLHDALLAEGASVHSYGMCGASADAWLQKTTVSCGRAERHDKAAPIAETGKQEYTWTIRADREASPQSGARRSGRCDGRLRLAAIAEGMDL